MKRITINPKELFDSRQYGFSQGVVALIGKMIFLSGQVAWDANESILGENDLEEQTRQSLKNIEIALSNVQATLENVVMLRLYIVQYKKGDGPIINGVLKEFFGTEYPPASTWVSVAGLAYDGFIIEIETRDVI